MQTEQHVIEQTECWVKSVVIGCNFCPFAKRELESGGIRYRVFNGEVFEDCLQVLIDECLYLDGSSNTETTLLIYPKAFTEFDDYLQLVELSEALLVKQGYEGVYQLASFHPGYCFADTDSDDAANFTNRSPYPMLHLIREASMEKALQHYPDAEDIPRRNITYARAKGSKKMQAMLDSCYQMDNK